MTATAAGAAAARSLGERPTILVVDGDQVARRYLEVSLASAGKFHVEAAADIAAAQAILNTQVVHLVLSELALPDGDGTRFLWRMRQDRRMRGIPFLCLSSDDRVARRVTTLELGARDFLVKWPTVTELIARIGAALRDAAELRRQLATRRSYLSGDFAGLSFADLVNQLNLSRRTGQLAIVTPRAGGRIALVQGAIWHASFGNLEGPEAVYEVMAVRDGQFEFLPVEGIERETPRTVSMSPTALLMEGARRLDMQRLAAGRGAATAADGAVPAPSGAPAPIEGKSDAPDACPPTAYAECDRVLRDPFALGELLVLDKAALRERTAVAGDAGRVHALLVADLAIGTSSLAALASPLADVHLAQALSTEPRTLALWYDLRGGAVFDVVLVDERQPAAWLDALARRATVLVLAPSLGNWLDWPIDARLALTTLLQQVRPALLLGLGSAAVRDTIDNLQRLSGTDVPVQHTETPLDAPDADLRGALADAVQVVAATARAARAPGAVAVGA